MKVSLAHALAAYQTVAPAGFQRLPVRSLEYVTRYPNLISVTAEACEALGLKGLKEAQLNAIGALYEPEQNLLHFKLRNASHKVVGEKVLHLGDRSEQTFQCSSSSGLLIHGIGNKSKAVLVSNLLDFIVLATQNIETRAYC